MSASIPDPNVNPQETTATVLPLPLDEDGRRRNDALDLTRALREQLLRLSQHYAEDTSRLIAALTECHAKLEQFHSQHAAQRTHQATLEAELFSLTGDLRFLRERLARERQRAARLAEAARLPWWAFARRRSSLASIKADDTP